MRRRLCALICFCIGWAMPLAAHAAVWTVEHDLLVRREGDAQVEVRAPEDVRALSPRSDGGTWLLAADGLWSITPEGDVELHFDSAARGLGNPERLAADAYDGSAWVATDAPLLLHVARDGTLLHGTSLAAPAAALATDLAQAAWVVTGPMLVHHAHDGSAIATRSLGLARDENAMALAIDAFHGRIWLGTTAALYYLSSDDATVPPRPVIRGEITGLTLDQLTQTTLAIADGALVAFDGTERRQDPARLLAANEPARAVAYNASTDAFIGETAGASVEVGSDHHLLLRASSASGSLLAGTPLRVAPTIALVRPPSGGAVADPAAEIVLGIGAECNGRACAMPSSYMLQARIDASIGGMRLGDATVDMNGRVTFPLQPAMTPGENSLAATVTDMFGHAITLERARWTFIAQEPVGEPGPAAQAGRDDASPPKAANKAPSVSLTSPAGGAVFSTGSGITLNATATDIDGSIAKVEFYRAGNILIGTVTAAPYRLVWTNAIAGNYSLTAKAYDDRKATATSSPVTIVVVDNQLPMVTLTSPAPGSFVNVAAAVTLEAIASDADGTVTGVEFFDATTSIGRVATSPYRLVWNASPVGIHAISAQATDDRGAVARSSSVDLVVGAPPIVVVTSPIACSTVFGPLDFLLAADAMSTSGVITSVAFFDNGSLVGTARAAPWRVTLPNASIGSHAITAKATDEHGLTTTSRPSTFNIHGANQPPSVAITAPGEGTHFASGAPVNLIATASDTDGTIAAVEFRIGSASGALIGRAARAPYAVTWTNAGPGSYAAVAVAYDDTNATSTSAPVHFTVDPNVPPAVSLTAPAANTSYTAPANVSLAAGASDTDGSIVKVEFFAGTSLIGSATTAPYGAVWSGVGAGAYSITAKATDNAGGVATSAAVPITVASNALPTVALTSPVRGNQYFAPATIALSADAQDTDGAIVGVDFYASGILVGHASSLPYRAVWDGVAEGTYAITAKAIDSAGGSVTSAPVSVTVAGAPSLNIDGALADATIDDDNILVRGFVSAPANAAVTVNGVVTHIDDLGRFQANDIPLVPGVNTITAIVTSQDGQSSSQSITINSTGAGAFVVHAAPTEGLESLQVTFTVEDPAGTPFKQIFVDLDGDGFPNLILTSDQFVDGKVTLRATYPVGTWLAVLTAYDEQDRVIYSTSKSIVVRIPAILQNDLRGVYDGMITRLRAGNIPGALTAFTGSAYEKYNAIFTQLQPSLASLVEQLGELREVTFNMDLAEFGFVRSTPDGAQKFMLYMIRAEDGIWRIDGM
jgi:hypothetical protein